MVYYCVRKPQENGVQKRGLSAAVRFKPSPCKPRVNRNIQRERQREEDAHGCQAERGHRVPEPRRQARHPQSSRPAQGACGRLRLLL